MAVAIQVSLQMHRIRTRIFVGVIAITVLSPAVSAELFGRGPLDLQAGGMVLVTPKFEGSKEHEVFGVPLVAPAGSSEFGFIQYRGPEDLRFRVINQGGFEAGPLTGWRFDRDESDSDHLYGLGDVDGGLVLGGYAAYRFGWFTPFLSYSNQVTGDDTGGLLRFGAEAPVTIISGVRIIGQIGATWADQDFMDAFFSVDGMQAKNSALNQYDADSGVKDVYMGFSADVPLSQLWSLRLMGHYSRLIGDAAESPIVETENQFFVGLGLTYQLTIDR